MNAVRGFFVVLLAHQAMGGAVRSPPSFSKPVYSDSYLPAAMQVIFHAVDQLKLVHSDDTREAITSTTPISLTEPTEGTEVPSTTVRPTTGQADKQEETSSEDAETTTDSVKHTTAEQIRPEVDPEKPPIRRCREYGCRKLRTAVDAVGSKDVSGTSSSSTAQTEQKKKEPTSDSVVQALYEIVKPTPSGLADEIIEESKSATGVSAEKLEALEDEEDENRFTRLGERVTQVPRPSLTSYLKRAKVPPRATLQQLANLYDSLSKDARKQGFGKYTGYSDEVLNTLETSAEGGVAPQLRNILDKVLERNELTREDAKTRTKQAVKDLDNPSSDLSRELRPLLPLRYTT